MQSSEDSTTYVLDGVRVCKVTESDDGEQLKFGPRVAAVLQLDPAGGLVIQQTGKSRCSNIISCSVTRGMVCRIGRRIFMLSTAKHDAAQDDGCGGYSIEVPEIGDASKFQAALDRITQAVPAAPDNTATQMNVFDRKTDKGSADMYFYYYGMFQHQQNMLQDLVRTGTYYHAIIENRADFAGKVVVDVGAGSSILSQFAAQAGARKVYAIEASPMAKWAAQLCKSNPAAANVVEVVEGKVEVVHKEIPEKADILVSEPMGTLLVNERMLESYLYARDHLLKPGGKMFPSLGRIHIAAFSDPVLHAELMAKGGFWTSSNFYGVDLTTLYGPASESFFNQVVVDAFAPELLVSKPYTEVIDFLTVKEEDLLRIKLPIDMEIGIDCVVHGIACWFDVLFDGTTVKYWLSTAPGQPTTHWFQLRCTLQVPLQVSAGDRITGEMLLVAHERQSYDIHITVRAPSTVPGGPEQTSTAKLDLKDPYYRQMVSSALHSWETIHQDPPPAPPPPPPPPRQQNAEGATSSQQRPSSQLPDQATTQAWPPV